MAVLRTKTAGVVQIRVYDKDGQKGKNVCVLNNGGCSQLCLPTSEHTRTCFCTTGYSLTADRSTCRGVESFLMYSSHDGIRGVSLDPSDHSDTLIPITGTLLAAGLDFHAGNDTLYWTDLGSNKISRAARDQTWREDVTNTGIVRAEGVAVDWITGNVYWTDHGSDLIEVSRVSTAYRAVIISEGLDQPRAIAVQPLEGFLVWTETGQSPKISRSRLDGSERTVLVNSELIWPSGVAIDYKENKLYWCDARTHRIERIHLDSGKKREIILKDNNADLFSVAVYGSYLYWSDRSYSNGSIRRGSKNDASDGETLRSGLGKSLRDVKVYNREREKGINECGHSNGGCEQLCFYLGSNRKSCSCAQGYLAPDGASCRVREVYLLYSERTALRSVGISEPPSTPAAAYQHPEYFKNIIALTFDYRQPRSRVFFSDGHYGNIQVMNDDWTGRRVLAENVGSVEGLAYHRGWDVLYWTSSTASMITRHSLDQSRAGAWNRDTVVQMDRDDHPHVLALDECQNLMFWTNWSERKAGIMRSSVWGRGVRVIISEGLVTPSGLTIDPQAEKLYFSDSSVGSVERCEYDGSLRHVVMKASSVSGLVLYRDFLFWLDWERRALMRADKLTGENITVIRDQISQQSVGIAAVANDTHRCELSLCNVNNGGCSDLCLLTPNAMVTCACRGERTLLHDNRCVLLNSSCNTHSEFQCANGECIDYELACDGVAHCKDKSDEKRQYCDKRDCREGYKRCNNQHCVVNTRFCDGVNDCGDNSDEASCNNVCSSSERRCADGACVSQSSWCDQIIDCADASDEKNCSSVDCVDYYRLGVRVYDGVFLRCNSTSLCVLPHWVCDGADDCGDYSDETHCHTAAGQVCAEGLFSCPSGSCISTAWLCDGQNDCKDGEDELQCDSSCAIDQFSCFMSRCVSRQWLCDGEDDCGDGADENPELCGSVSCAPGAFRCPDSYVCVSRRWVCDGERDCPDGSDELATAGCALNLTCSDVAFHCSNGDCIPQRFVCDRDDDCGDGSDESLQCKYHACGKAEFQCSDGRCLPSVQWECDGFPDCLDQSDEAPLNPKCSAAESLCNGSFFMCANGRCVPLPSVCNLHDDCGDQSDERSCNVNECLNLRVSQCTQDCHDLSVGYKCVCWPGFRLKTDGRTCVDINECVERFPCSQQCINTYGSYKCVCADGYKPLETDTHSCRAVSGFFAGSLNKYLRILHLFNRFYLNKESVRGFSLKDSWRTLKGSKVYFIGALSHY